jgi:hypothetical protein
MAETIVSPGVLAIENDQSFITQQPVQAGAAIVGPTVKGKVGIPTLVTTYSEYSNVFGTTFLSGSQTFSYLTSISAYNYFNSGGTSLLVTRVVSGSTINDWTPATSSVIPSSTALTTASAIFNLTNAATLAFSASINGVNVLFSGSSPQNVFNNVTSSINGNATINSTASYSAPNLILSSVNPNGLLGNSYYYTSGSTTVYYTGGTNTEAFVLETLSEGVIMNSVGPTGSNGTLLSGSAENYRWQITAQDINAGTFTLVIRQGNDTANSPSILETWTNLSMDPFAPNYIENALGNQIETVAVDNGEYYIQLTGSFANRSRYVRVSKVNTTTPTYLDNNGNPKPQFTGSIPYLSLGVFGDGKGKNIPTGIAGNYYENISNTNTQGLTAASYATSISLLANKDAYNYNFITTPGLIGDGTNYAAHYPLIQQLNTMVQNRGDAMSIIDIVGYNSPILTVTGNTISFDTSYAATYWPWLKTIDPNSGQQVWVPASTMIPSVYAFNDNVAYPWFAPAGTNRGIIPTAIQTERILTQGNRDTLYKKNVNAIATFPNAGITVFGQKTLQKKPSALDRVNVRRLLIELKNYISQVADTFVFEQNNAITRNNFLSIVNPYLSTIQQQQGLTAFKVVMDETNNPPSVVDQNQLIGQIYLQPTRTVEFIILDFNILPTGATFPA